MRAPSETDQAATYLANLIMVDRESSPLKLRFRHVEGFRALMITRSATGAASMLHVSQPAVSRLIREMERAVGLDLFDRRGRRLVPTSTAERLFDEIERCFLGLDHINSFCQRQRSADTKSTILVSVPSAAIALLPKAISRYRAEIVSDVFSVNTRNTDGAIGWVSSQKAHLGLGSKPLNVSGIVCRPISTFNSACALPAGHRLADRPVISVRDLQGENFIALGKAEGVRHRVDEIFCEYDVQPNEVVESPMVSAACAMVRAGVGIALVDQYSGSLFADSGDVVFRRFEPAVPVTTYAYWPDDASPHFFRLRFVEFLEEISRETVALMSRVMERGLETVATAGRPREVAPHRAP
jgi:DNA-binding transcriptional LysR family regulator